MRLSLSLALACLLIATATCEQPPGRDAIRLSKVKALTLRAHRMTAAHRVSPIPQLNCVGPSNQLCALHQPEVMRCTNQGYDYDVEDVQWTCKADLPLEFKLGATDVICEGYRNADDKWVLKGSCGVEYRMLLTELGEKRYGRRYRDESNGRKSGMSGDQKASSWLGQLIFFGFFVFVAWVIIFPLVMRCLEPRGNRRAPGAGGSRGGHGGGPDDDSGPPPPYSTFDPKKSSSSQQVWTPGFWSGALGGALGGGAAGYGMGRAANSGRRTTSSRSNYNRSDYDRSDYDPGEGSSRSPQVSSSASSTGFGSTRRR